MDSSASVCWQPSDRLLELEHSYMQIYSESILGSYGGRKDIPFKIIY